MLATDGMRLGRRSGGQVRVMPWHEFEILIFRGVNPFSVIRDVTQEFVQSCYPGARSTVDVTGTSSKYAP